jgi:hypothetical protein
MRDTTQMNPPHIYHPNVSPPAGLTYAPPTAVDSSASRSSPPHAKAVATRGDAAVSVTTAAASASAATMSQPVTGLNSDNMAKTILSMEEEDMTPDQMACR